MHDFSLSRRSILKAAAAGLPAWLAAELCAQERPKPAADKLKVALIGCGNRGRVIAQNAAKFGTVVAVCDVDATRAAAAAKQFGGAKPYSDFRKLLDTEKDIPLILNGTPDHWHTLINLAALKRGKDVYSEKPLTLTIDEGKRLVAAVKATGRVLQTGSQQRSDARFRLACEAVRNGRLGKLTKVTTILPTGLVGGPFPTAPVPKELDWEMWQGQAPATQYVPERTHRYFRYWVEYSNGTLTDWGAHHNDIALWALGLDHSGPVSAEGKVLSKQVPGGYSAPAEYAITFTYAGGLEHRCVSTPVNTISGAKVREPKPGERPHGILFEGADGWLYVTRGKIEASKPEVINDKFADRDVRLQVSTDHMGNFFECVRTRKPPICSAEVGHRAVSVCHLGGIALRLGRKVRWDPAKEEFVGDPEANAQLARPQRKPWTYDGV